MAAKKPNSNSATACEQVEQAWLDAGRRGDTKTMQSLRKTHPKWLALARVRTVAIFRSDVVHREQVLLLSARLVRFACRCLSAGCR